MQRREPDLRDEMLNDPYSSPPNSSLPRSSRDFENSDGNFKRSDEKFEVNASLGKLPWFLWSLVSFCLIGLGVLSWFSFEQAGLHKKELNKALLIQKQLEAEFLSLDNKQKDSAGELVMSDQQIRQAVIAVEGRIKQELGRKLSALDQRSAGVATELEATRQALSLVEGDLRDVSSSIKADVVRLLETLPGIFESIELLREQLNGQRQLLVQEIRRFEDSMSSSEYKSLELQDKVTSVYDQQKMILDELVVQAEINRKVIVLSSRLDKLTDNLKDTLEVVSSSRRSISEQDGFAVEILEENVDKIERRISEQDLRLKSIDESRRQVNSRLLEVENRLNRN